MADGLPGRPRALPNPLPPSRNDWWKAGACANHRHPEWFTGPCHNPGGQGGRGPLTRNANMALVVCAACTQRRPCLAEALEFTEQVGVWGGLTDQERRLYEHERAVILRERFGSA